ncbi:MAG TPA: DUF2938 domain-containing protein [Pseudolabrys sp.]|nr:DUF2938 domain-containing protein [Pseudolabrys sp.]
MIEAILIDAILIGAGATAVLDLWSLARNRLAGAAAPDYAPVGRWLAHMTRGQFVHRAIARSAPVKGERLLGWSAHYLTGIAFAGALLAVFPAWAREPTLLPALIAGITSAAAPFLLMQPGMGLGLAARRAPDPRAARLRTLTTHTVFGLGLYAAGWALRAIAF